MTAVTKNMGTADTTTLVAVPLCPTTAIEDTKIILIPKIVVLQDSIKRGEPITKATIKEIYDIAYSLLKHRHKYTDLVWTSTGNTSTYPTTTNDFWTDYPAQFNNLVELGSPLLQGVIFEKWFICPDAYNIRMLDSAPMVYSRQYKLPNGSGINYDARTGKNMPPNLQPSSLGAIFDFYMDTSKTIGTNQQLTINSSGDTLVYIDSVEYSTVSLTKQTITFKPKNVRTHITIHWAEGDSSVHTKSYEVYHPLVRWPWGSGHRNAIKTKAYWETVNENYVNINTEGYLDVRLNGSVIPEAKIFALTPQTSLNTTVTDANITSIYALYQILMILCNHSHTYLDFDISYSNKISTAQSNITILEDFYETLNQQVSFSAPGYTYRQPTGDYDMYGDPIYESVFSGYTGAITDVSVFSQPVVL
jgi:hypothetical protein